MTAVPTVVLGSPVKDPLMATLAKALEQADISVIVVDLDPRAPHDMPGAASDATHEALFREALAGVSGRVVIGGFSVGARVAAALCPELAPAGLLCFGYPFHSAKAPTQRRGLDALSRSQVPTRIIQGTRDNHGTAAEVRSYRLPDSVEFVWLDDGNHRFIPRKRSGRTYAEHLTTAVSSAISFVRSV